MRVFCRLTKKPLGNRASQLSDAALSQAVSQGNWEKAWPGHRPRPPPFSNSNNDWSAGAAGVGWGRNQDSQPRLGVRPPFWFVWLSGTFRVPSRFRAVLHVRGPRGPRPSVRLEPGSAPGGSGGGGRMSAEAADREAATSSRPCTPPQTSWFEFLLQESLLEKHLRKPCPGKRGPCGPRTALGAPGAPRLPLPRPNDPGRRASGPSCGAARSLTGHQNCPRGAPLREA